MKMTLILFLMICGIVFTSSIQAKNLDNINGVGQNNNGQSLVATQDISDPRGANIKDTPTAPSLAILIVVGFFFAKKHQNLAKKHRDLTKKN